METPIQLIDMPEDSMRHILERCDFVSIQCLRKTCHTFRNFIDETKPSQLNVLDISGQTFSLTFSENNSNDLYPTGTKIQLDYYDMSDGNTLVIWHRKDGNRKKLIENISYLDLLSLDLGTVLKSKQSHWDKISLRCHEEVLKKFRVNLLALKSPLKVSTLSVHTGKSENLVAVMKSICPDTLTHLHVAALCEQWNMSKIVKLEQWKRAKEVDMKTVWVSMNVKDYAHFESAKICFMQVKMDALLEVKKIFLNTPSITKQLEMNVVFFRGFPKLTELNRTFGQCYLIDDDCRCWFFRRPDNYVLRMKYLKTGNYFDINIITTGDVPQEAVIL